MKLQPQNDTPGITPKVAITTEEIVLALHSVMVALESSPGSYGRKLAWDRVNKLKARL